MELLEDVPYALQVVKADMLQGKPIRWYMFSRVISGMEANRERIQAPDCLKAATEILNFLERQRCRDVSVLSEVFAFMLDVCNQLYDSGLPSERIKPFRSPHGEESELDMVWSALIASNLGLLKLQLKFGMVMLTPRSADRVCIDSMLGVLVHWGGMSPRDRLEAAVEEKIRVDLSSESRRRRMCFVFRMLLIVIVSRLYTRPYLYTCWWYRYRRELFPECYELIFESIPEPFVTSTEVESFLERYLSDAHSTLIREVTEAFKLLPELARVPGPRSLQHLCRIQVRDSLRRNLNLPHGVPSLPLPTKLKKYITLNDDGDYSVFIDTRHLHSWRARNLCPTRGLWEINLPETDDSTIAFLKNL